MQQLTYIELVKLEQPDYVKLNRVETSQLAWGIEGLIARELKYYGRGPAGGMFIFWWKCPVLPCLMH